MFIFPQAAEILSSLLPRQTKVRNTQTIHLPSIKGPISLHYQEPPVPFNGHGDLIVNQVSLTEFSKNTFRANLLQPYLTKPLVLPQAKTIHHIGDPQNKFISTAKEPQAEQVFLFKFQHRTSSSLTALQNLHPCDASPQDNQRGWCRCWVLQTI